MIEDQDIEIKIDESADTGQTVDKAPTPDEAVADLKKQLEAANAERDRAAHERAESDRRAVEATKRADTATAEVRSSEAQIISNAAETIERDILIARGNLRDAMAAADYDAQADLQVVISDLAAKRLQLNNAKAQLETRSKLTEGRVYESRQQSRDPVEEWASNLSPRSRDWILSHRDAVANDAAQRKLTAAHNSAVELEGLRADSDEYFSYVEGKLGYRKVETQQQSAPRQPATVMPSAPVSNAGASPQRQMSNVVTLSAVERDVAKSLGMTEKEYASNKLVLIKEGKLTA